MKKLIFLLSILLFASNTYAGFGYKSLTSTSGIAVPIKLESEGIYNLVINVEFLKEPYDKKPYDSDNYSELINRLRVEWNDIAIQLILEKPNLKLTEMVKLKQSLQIKMDALIKSSKAKHNISNNAEVVYSISSFFIVKPE